MTIINIVKVADDQICSSYYWKSRRFPCRVDAGSYWFMYSVFRFPFSSMCATFSAMLWRGNTWGTKPYAMTSSFQNPSQTDFVIFKLNEIELWYTARSHSRFWAGFFIACSFSRSLCVSCCECLNLPAILLISDEESCRHFKTFTAGDWAYGCVSFYSWLTRKRLLAYIETKAPQYPVSWCGYLTIKKLFFKPEWVPSQ